MLEYYAENFIFVLYHCPMSRATKDNREYLRKQLHLLLPKTSILETEEQTRPYECDGLTAYQQKPWLVVLPESIEQVQNILRLCHNEGVPVVARGAGTGLSGGALPLADGVLLSLAKFNRILDINPANRSAIVEPWCT